MQQSTNEKDEKSSKSSTSQAQARAAQEPSQALEVPQDLQLPEDFDRPPSSQSTDPEEVTKLKKKIMELTIYMRVTMTKVEQQTQAYKAREVNLQKKFNDRLRELEDMIQHRDADIAEFERLTPIVLEKNQKLEEQNMKLRQDVKDLSALVFSLNKEINALKTQRNRAEMEKSLAEKLKEQVNEQLQKILDSKNMSSQGTGMGIGVTQLQQDKLDILGQVEDAEKEIIDQRIKNRQMRDKIHELESLKTLPYYDDVIDKEYEQAIDELTNRMSMPPRSPKKAEKKQSTNKDTQYKYDDDDKSYELRKENKQLKLQLQKANNQLELSKKGVSNKPELVQRDREEVDKLKLEIEGLNKYIQILMKQNGDPEMLKRYLLKNQSLNDEIRTLKKIIRHQGNGLIEYEFNDPTRVLRDETSYYRKMNHGLLQNLGYCRNENSSLKQQVFELRRTSHGMVSQQFNGQQSNQCSQRSLSQRIGEANETETQPDQYQTIQDDQASRTVDETRPPEIMSLTNPNSPMMTQTNFDSNHQSMGKHRVPEGKRKLNYELPNQVIKQAFQYIQEKPKMTRTSPKNRYDSELTKKLKHNLKVSSSRTALQGFATPKSRAAKGVSIDVRNTSTSMGPQGLQRQKSRGHNRIKSEMTGAIPGQQESVKLPDIQA